MLVGTSGSAQSSLSICWRTAILVFSRIKSILETSALSSESVESFAPEFVCAYRPITMPRSITRNSLKNAFTLLLTVLPPFHLCRPAAARLTMRPLYIQRKPKAICISERLLDAHLHDFAMQQIAYHRLMFI